MENVSTFSLASDQYARFRPVYPSALFDFLATLAPSRDLAWDCATVSGQAAVALARYFERVVATDISAEQICHAEPHESITYAVKSGRIDRVGECFG